MKSSKVTPGRIAAITFACLVLSVTFFAPRLWLMRHYVKGSFQWDRAHTFLLQCEEPLRRDVESAMHWRLLPPLVCHALHLHGKAPLVLPWLGVVACTAYVAVLFRRRADDWRFVAGGTLLFATTSAVIVPVGWLGMNDAWVWLGLLAVAFGRTPWAVPLACLLAPWVDERFLIGFPLAWLVRQFDRTEGSKWSAMLKGFWLAPYIVLRLWLTTHDQAASEATRQFLASHIRQSLILVPLVPLGWWMGLRAAWAAVIYAGWSVPRHVLLVGGITLFFTAGISVLLASDLSRSIAIIMPVVFLGCFEFARRNPLAAPRTLLALGVINLLIPAAHMTYIKIDPISSLPIEILRFLRPI